MGILASKDELQEQFNKRRTTTSQRNLLVCTVLLCNTYLKNQSKDQVEKRKIPEWVETTTTQWREKTKGSDKI